MKGAYPIFIMDDGADFLVKIPDFDIDTQGKDLADAMAMARDAIGLVGIQLEDMNKTIPSPNSFNQKLDPNYNIHTLVDVDFDEYRRMNDTRLVRKNCTIPYNLSIMAEKEGINFSQVLRNALIEILGIKNYKH